MRLWSIHPKYMDTKGLLALWREGLLAKAVLEGKTKGYRSHPQISRFKEAENPVSLINAYLFFVFREAEKRGFAFDRKKIKEEILKEQIPVSKGQRDYEFKHLKDKLKARDKTKLKELRSVSRIELNPLFYLVEGGVECWEKAHKNLLGVIKLKAAAASMNHPDRH